MDFKDLIRNQKFTLVVSLPSNNLELAKAALLWTRCKHCRIPRKRL